MTPTQRLKKMHKRAAELQKRHPGWSYRTAQKKAGEEFRNGGTKKKKGTQKKKAVRIGGSSKSRSIGSVPDTQTQSQLKSRLVKSLEEQAAWALLAHQTAHSAKDRTANGKKAREVLRKLKAAKSV